MKDKVDVLTIGAWAFGAPVAWSMAETKMRILCLEQGDWMKQSEYPANRRDFEARAFSDYATSPNIRKGPADYPINDDNSPIKVMNFNAVRGSTIMNTAHYPRLHPSDILAAAGARHSHEVRPVMYGGRNLKGTPRVWNDPERSMMNEWGRCHDVGNFFIVDASIFVIAGGVNPTSTIQALALYIAHGMKQRLATLFT